VQEASVARDEPVANLRGRYASPDSGPPAGQRVTGGRQVSVSRFIQPIVNGLPPWERPSALLRGKGKPKVASAVV